MSCDCILSEFVPDTHALLNIRGGDTVAQSDDELSDLFNVNEVLCVLGSRAHNLCTTRNLKRLLFLRQLLVGDKIPLAGNGETSV